MLMPSSVIRAYCYHPAERRLDILFVTGKLYSYHDLPPDVYGAMRNALSKGEFFNAHIRNRYRYTRQHSAFAK